MAGFFKFIFRVLLIVYIAIILALVVPPLAGYTTATVQEGTSGNQAVGTVEYAKRISLQDLKEGERILVTGAGSVNVYTIRAIDMQNSVVTAADAVDREIPVRSYVYRMVLAVPYIGYIVIALQTMEGAIVLALIAALLILLCVLSGVWSRKAKEKKLRKKELKAEKEISGGRSNEQTASEMAAADDRSGADRVMNARAEAYFAAKRAEQSRETALEEYEDFPPKALSASELKDAGSASTYGNTEYFDEDEEDGEVDSWLHDDVDDDELYAGLNNPAATESLMATARLFAINRAAQLKEQIASEDLEKTKVVKPNDIQAALSETSVPVSSAVERESEEKKNASPIRKIEVDKVINLKELKEIDQDTQQIVLTINIKVISE